MMINLFAIKESRVKTWQTAAPMDIDGKRNEQKGNKIRFYPGAGLRFRSTYANLRTYEQEIRNLCNADTVALEYVMDPHVTHEAPGA